MVYNPSVTLGATQTASVTTLSKQCTSVLVSTAEISSVQNKRDQVHETSIEFTFPIQSCDQAVADAGDSLAYEVLESVTDSAPCVCLIS